MNLAKKIIISLGTLIVGIPLFTLVTNNSLTTTTLSNNFFYVLVIIYYYWD
jgi:hypothetical protein